jgi:hypothetical protein
MADVREARTEREHRQFARAGVVVVLGVIACVLLAAVIVLTHRPHTRELTPGQKQPSALAFLDPGRG